MTENQELNAQMDRIASLQRETNLVLDRVEAGLNRIALARAKLDSEWEIVDGGWVYIGA